MTKFVLVLFFSVQIFSLETHIIDVVIPCHPKDCLTLDKVIDGIRRYGKDVRRIMVISEKRLTDRAEWIPENIFPFTKYDLAEVIFKDRFAAREFVDRPHSRIGWIYQQLLKFYAPFVINGISDYVLILDADLIFVRPVEFIDDDVMLFSTSCENHMPYFLHASRLISGFKKVYGKYSGICHHMLFCRDILRRLFNLVETTHNTKFWTAFCQAIDPSDADLSSASEYEIYFNFVFTHYKKQAKIRQLRMENCCSKPAIDFAIKYQAVWRNTPCDCISCQEHMRRRKRFS